MAEDGGGLHLELAVLVEVDDGAAGAVAAVAVCGLLSLQAAGLIYKYQTLRLLPLEDVEKEESVRKARVFVLSFGAN